MVNNSDIHPTGLRVLVLMDPVPETYGSIALTPEAIQRDKIAQIRGTLVEVGPLAWKDGGALSLGSRVIIRRYAGELVTGNDGISYRITNDNDLYATFKDPVTVFTKA